MLDKLDYSYNDINSIVHRISPIFKFIGLFFYVLICLLKFNNILFIWNILIVFILILFSNVKYMRYLRVLWNLKFLIIIYYFFTLNTLSMELSDVNILLFKILFFIYYLKVIVFTTTKESMGKGLSFILNIFNLIGISIRKIEMFFINVFTYLLFLLTNNNEYINSLEFKGINYTHGNIIDKWKIFFSNIKKVNELSKKDYKKRKKGLEDKLFKSKANKLYKYRNRYNIFDIIYMIANIGMLIFYILVVR